MLKKKNLLRALSLVLCFAMLLAGCAEKGSEEPGYKELAGVYLSNLTVEGGMSVKMYLQIGEDGSFIFSRSPDFSSREKGAGMLEKNADGKDSFNYEIVRDEAVEKGTHVSTFEVTEEGGIQFTSLMWFGAATPRFIAEDGTETYPVFLPYDESMEEPAETTKAAVTTPASAPAAEPGESTAAPEETEAPETTQPAATEPRETEPAVTETKPSEPAETAPAETQAKPTQPKETEPEKTEPAETEPKETEPKETEAPQPAFREGVYRGTVDKHVDAMESDIHYDITLTLQGGSYTYEVAITLSGKLDYSDTEVYNGSYTVDGLNLTMTGTLKSAAVNADGSLSVTGIFSSFAGSNDTVILYG